MKMKSFNNFVRAPEGPNSGGAEDPNEETLLPETQLKAARNFYMSRGKDTFVLDSTFRLLQGEKIRTLGNSASRALVALSPQFKDLRDELGKKLPRSSAVVQHIKDDLGSVVTFAAKWKNQRLSPEDIKFFRDNFSSKIDEVLLTKLANEADALAKSEKKNETQSNESSAEPAPPDQFARTQRIFTRLLLEELKAEDGTSLTDFISKITKGEIKRVVPTGLWRDKLVSQLIEAADEGVNVAAKRRIVEQFLITLPEIARSSIENRPDLTDEQKEKVRVAAQAIYERANQLRSDRLNQDAKTNAAETARLNQTSATAYKILLNLGVIPPLREPLDVDDKKSGQSKRQYDAMVRRAIAERSSAEREEMTEFMAERNKIIPEHLLEFFKRIEQGAEMRGIFPGTLGSVLSSTGAKGRELFSRLIREIESRPAAERFERPKGPARPEGEFPTYSAFDENTGKMMIPPPEMVAALENASKTLERDVSRLGRISEQIRIAQFEILSTDISDLITLAKRLDVLEADVHIPDIKANLYQARQAMTTGVSRGDPGSLKWRATTHMSNYISGITYQISETEALLLNTRKALLLKLINVAREQMSNAPEGSDFGQLPEVLTDYELLVRRTRTKMSELRDAINFFITE